VVLYWNVVGLVWPLTLKVRDDLSTVNVALFSKEMVELLAWPWRRCQIIQGHGKWLL